MWKWWNFNHFFKFEIKFESSQKTHFHGVAALLLYDWDLILSILASDYTGSESSFLRPLTAIMIPLIIAHTQPIMNIPNKNYNRAIT